MTERHVTWHSATVDRAARWAITGTRGATVWLTGLSGAGKSTVAAELERHLVAARVPAYRLDGDNLRHGLNRDLGFGPADRTENLRRVTEVAALMADAGLVCIASTISPLEAHRAAARDRHRALALPFFEVFVSTPIEVCRARDPKGLYAKADRGELTGFTGVDAPYEPPQAPELTLETHVMSVGQAAEACLGLLAGAGIVGPDVIGSSPPPPSRG